METGVLLKLYREAEKKASRLGDARATLPAGSSRARVTTANAKWARAAEAREYYRRMLAERGVTP